MNEQSPELNKNTHISTEEMEEYTNWLASHPEEEVVQLSQMECGLKIIGLGVLFVNFEARHNLKDLHAIINLTPEDAPKHPIREPARVDLIPIVSQLNFLKKQTNVLKEKLEELEIQYKKLSNAVGMIHKNILDHTR